MVDPVAAIQNKLDTGYGYRLSDSEGGGYAISVSPGFITRQEFEFLHLVPGVRRLSLGERRHGDSSTVDRFPWLESLAIETPEGVTDRDLEAIRTLHHLRRLEILGPYGAWFLGERESDFLSDMPALETLAIISPGFDNQGIRIASHAQNLTTLILSGSFDSEGLESLSPLTSLRHLWLDGTFDDHGLKSLAGMADLEVLALTSPSLTGRSLADVSPLARLTTVRIVNRDQPLDVSGLSELPGLTNLDLGGTVITRDVLASVARCDNVRVLSLRGTETGDAEIKALAPAVALEWLDLRQTRVTDAGLAKLASLTALRVLQLGDGGRTTGRAIEHLPTLPCLEHLDMQNLDLPPEAWPALLRQPALKILTTSTIAPKNPAWVAFQAEHRPIALRQPDWQAPFPLDARHFDPPRLP